MNEDRPGRLVQLAGTATTESQEETGTVVTEKMESQAEMGKAAMGFRARMEEMEREV